MIICSASNIDLIQGSLGYGDATEGINITDWRISNTQSAIAGQSGVFNIFNSSSITPNISIVDNGTVGIGTVPSISSTSKMEIVGNVNITGAYNINNRNVINDTSNYILATSNLLVERINAGGGGSGSGALTSGGNLSLSNNATSNTILSIANSNVIVGSSNYTSNYSSNYTSNYTSNVVTEQYTAAATPTFSIGGPSTSDSITSSIDKFMIFTNANINNTFTVPAGGLNCDILMIGGGGRGYNGGGGAGACIVAINQTLPAGSCVVNVGGGGTTNTVNGSDSFIKVDNVDRYRAKGGGFCPTDGTISGSSGGCGGGTEMYIGSGNTASGGAAVSTNVVNGVIENTPPRITSNYAVMGNAGGNNSSPNNGGSGGGIGIGAVGTAGGAGGNGAYQVTLTGAATPINFRGYFANDSTSFGVQDGTTTNYYIGGGGGAYKAGMGVQWGGLGGGGYYRGGYYYSGVANTGSGGSAGGIGGSGIIIIRYRSVTTTTTPTTITVPITTTLTTTATAQATTLGTPSIELIRGIAGDSNQDYKLGNYEGNFKIMSSISNTDTDRLAITSSGNLSLSNNSTNSTALSIINSNVNIAITGAQITAATTPTFSVGGPSTSGTITYSIDKFMIFTSIGVNHTFTVPAGGLNCDILMIGGGGAGGGNAGGGGGAGACVVSINKTLPAGSCVVNVGAGSTTNGVNGGDSYITVGGTDRYRAKGGGGGGNQPGTSGGCGGGASYNTDTITENGGTALLTNVVPLTNGSTANGGANAYNHTELFAILGNDGGNNGSSNNVAGSGGGIGTVGSSGGARAGNGAYQVSINGTIYNFRSYFANGETFGVLNSADSQYYIGGGGGSFNNSGNGGLGGGGQGGGGIGVANTGSGGGGGGTGSGGSGIIIIRYRIVTTSTLGTPSIELVRGTQGDSNTDYKIGNYNGDFIIKSSVSNTDTDYLKISSTGAITNPTGTASWNTGSDRRIKENIERASYDKCYESICRLELNRFNYIKGFNTVSRDNKQLGFIAQEVYDIFPKAISSQPYNSDTLSIPDLLSIDVSQINYSLYGAVKKLIEINNNKELRLKKLECLLNVESDSSSNVVIDSDVLTSNVIVSEVIEDTMSSNVIVSEVIEDTMSSNVMVSEVIEDTMSSNVVVSEVVSMTSNVVIE